MNELAEAQKRLVAGHAIPASLDQWSVTPGMLELTGAGANSRRWRSDAFNSSECDNRIR